MALETVLVIRRNSDLDLILQKIARRPHHGTDRGASPGGSTGVASRDGRFEGEVGCGAGGTGPSQLPPGGKQLVHLVSVE